MPHVHSPDGDAGGEAAWVSCRIPHGEVPCHLGPPRRGCVDYPGQAAPDAPGCIYGAQRDAWWRKVFQSEL